MRWEPDHLRNDNSEERSSTSSVSSLAGDRDEPPSPQGEGKATSSPHPLKGKAEPDPDILAHLRSLELQAERFRQEYPDFELSDALKDPAFVRMTAPAVKMALRDAYYTLHREELRQREAAAIARAAASGGLRLREGGGLSAAALTRSDYRALDADHRASLKQQIRAAAARGEKIYP